MGLSHFHNYYAVWLRSLTPIIHFILLRLSHTVQSFPRGVLVLAGIIYLLFVVFPTTIISVSALVKNA
jgi:hypothetical protein